MVLEGRANWRRWRTEDRGRVPLYQREAEAGAEVVSGLPVSPEEIFREAMEFPRSETSHYSRVQRDMMKEHGTANSAVEGRGG